MVGPVVDAVVVGLGFGGIYQLKKLVDQGLSAIAIDSAPDVGGTWYWNKYPGAMSDTESYLYRYSWDIEDCMSYPWSHHYVYQPEILAYLQHVVDKFNLRKHMRFNTELISALWDDTSGHWNIATSTGDTFRTRYFVTALGLLSKQNFPDIEGIGDFAGEVFHTSRWPSDINLEEKRVGIIGNGSTGVQVITAIAKDVQKLVCFQRNPQYSVPSGQGPVTAEYRKQINDRYPDIWKEVKDSQFAFGFEETRQTTFGVDEQERERIFERGWKEGGGFRFMFGTFSDITVDERANEAACRFIRRKILETVKDPEKARKLLPTQPYAKRPLCDAGYYEQFNRENVDIVNLQETPITRITPGGIVTSDGTDYELDVIIFATGFDAVDGHYTRIVIEGRDGEVLRDRWQPKGATSYLGICVPNFPNMFMILGPNGPFCNLPPAIETQVEFVSGMIEVAESNRQQPKHSTIRSSKEADTNHPKRDSGPVIEATVEAEDEWTKVCDKMSSRSLFRRVDSWIFGGNIAGKKHAVLFYFGGLSRYRRTLSDVIKNDYRGFRPLVGSRFEQRLQNTSKI